MEFFPWPKYIFKFDGFFYNITLQILFMPYVYSRPYLYSFWQIFQALRLFPALSLFRTLEYSQFKNVYSTTRRDKSRLCKVNWNFLDLFFENKQQILRNKSGFLVSELVAGSSDQNIVVPTLFGMIKKLYYLFQTLTF